MWTHIFYSRGEWDVGIRLRSWALPVLITWTPWLFEIAIGPFFVSREKTLPF
jgi:hypothetical protein